MHASGFNYLCLSCLICLAMVVLCTFILSLMAFLLKLVLSHVVLLTSYGIVVSCHYQIFVEGVSLLLNFILITVKIIILLFL